MGNPSGVELGVDYAYGLHFLDGMFLDVASNFFVVVCRLRNLLDGRRGEAGRGGLVCLYMFHRCKY